MLLKDWIIENFDAIPDTMRWKRSSGEQFRFVRDTLSALVGADLLYEERQEICEVISTHRSKSIVLPVYKFERKDLGLKIILRENFYNWKMSIISTRPIILDYSALFYTKPPIEPDYTGDCLAPVYFEGFPPEYIFGYYEPSDRMRFSAEIWGDNEMWTVLFLTMQYFDVIKPMTWNTKASHKEQMDEDARRRKAYEQFKSMTEKDIRSYVESNV